MDNVKSLVYVVGRPASGKSTAVLSALGLLGLLPLPGRSVAPAVYLHGLLDEETGEVRGRYLGKVREGFPGTDALSMSASPRVVEFLGNSKGPAFVLGEGARLGTPKFFREVVAAGHRLTVVYLDASLEVAAERAAQRGSAQSPKWAAGAGTRAENAFHAAQKLHANTFIVDAVQPRERVAEQVAEVIRSAM